MKTILKIVIGIVGVYVGIFILWVMLGMSCMEMHSATECQDNTLTRVAFTIYPLGDK